MKNEIPKTPAGVVVDYEFLRQTSFEVPRGEIQSLKSKLAKALDDQKNCAGLAAVQIGSLFRMAIYNLPSKGVGYLINPQIISASGNQLSDEGCMSFPGRRVKIQRRSVVVVQSDHETKTFSGFEAAVVQHEIDHMNGITVIDRYRMKPKSSTKSNRSKAKRKASKASRKKNR